MYACVDMIPKIQKFSLFSYLSLTTFHPPHSTTHTPLLPRASSQISQRVMKFILAISFDNLESIVLKYVTMAMKNQEAANIKRFMNL